MNDFAQIHYFTANFVRALHLAAMVVHTKQSLTKCKVADLRNIISIDYKAVSLGLTKPNLILKILELAKPDQSSKHTKFNPDSDNDEPEPELEPVEPTSPDSDADSSDDDGPMVAVSNTAAKSDVADRRKNEREAKLALKEEQAKLKSEKALKQKQTKQKQALKSKKTPPPPPPDESSSSEDSDDDMPSSSQLSDFVKTNNSNSKINPKTKTKTKHNQHTVFRDDEDDLDGDDEDFENPFKYNHLTDKNFEQTKYDLVVDLSEVAESERRRRKIERKQSKMEKKRKGGGGSKLAMSIFGLANNNITGSKMISSNRMESKRRKKQIH